MSVSLLLLDPNYSSFSQSIRLGRRLSHPTLQSIREAMTHRIPEPRCSQFLPILDRELAFFPHVVGKQINACLNVTASILLIINLIVFFDSGRWTPDPSCCVLNWETEAIAVALTAMVAPSFFNLRPDDFGRKQQNLVDMTLRFEAVARYVALTIMEASLDGLKRATQMATLWIDVGNDLISTLHNFHMGSAVQAGLCKHYLERIPIWDDVSSAVSRKKLFLDVLCSPESRMAGLRAAQDEAKAKRVPGMIPAMYWFVQKTELLVEAPLYRKSGERLNSRYFRSAGKIYGDLSEMQELRYPNSLLKEDEIFFFFMDLERTQVLDDDALYEISDRAKEKLGGGKDGDKRRSSLRPGRMMKPTKNSKEKASPRSLKSRQSSVTETFASWFNTSGLGSSLDSESESVI